jgi:ABC-type antimicrobial peptide transport system permease subunit
MDTNEAFELIRQFYDNAWNNLLFLVSGAAAAMIIIMGIVMPVLFQWTQNRREKKEIQDIKNIANETIEKKLKEIENKFIELEKNINLVHGGVYYTQATLIKEPLSIFYSYLKALDCFLKAENGYNINRTFELMIKSANNVDKIDNDEIFNKYIDVIYLLEIFNINDIFIDKIKTMKEIKKIFG